MSVASVVHLLQSSILMIQSRSSDKEGDDGLTL